MTIPHDLPRPAQGPGGPSPATVAMVLVVLLAAVVLAWGLR